VPLLFAPGRRLIISSAALLTSLIFVSRETLVQVRLLPAVLSVPTLSMALVQVQTGGVALLSPRMPADVVSGSFASASVPLSSGRGLYLPTQSQASYCSTSLSPSAHRPSSCFVVDNEEANVRANVVVADGHADVRTSAVMTDDDNDDVANDGDFPDRRLCLGKIPGTTPTACSRP